MDGFCGDCGKQQSSIGFAWSLLFALAIVGMSAAPTQAADITGAWATDVRVCDKIFQKKGNALTLTSRSDTLGGGFIIEGNEIRGKTANCKIKNKKEDGDSVYLLATCATDIMLSDVEMALKIIDKDRVARFFPGLPELETPYYYRCPR
ncbi:MAG: hypothetical protein JOZ94_11915 [Xanthobacteraceae bacterium]|nr:hypothetical protein [Xanthobacteraceae bacterium]MBV9626721.1 hypothetical protein [Xanthobacteraceae bacterium]